MTLVNPDDKNSSDTNATVSKIKVKVPKKVLHFSDGVLEEYSTDEDEVDSPKEESLVNPAHLTWGPWFWYKAWAAGTTTLSVVDTMGEFLASFFGITTPRYYFEIEEQKRREKENKKRAELEQGWSQPSDALTVTVPLQKISSGQIPHPVNV